MPRLSITDRDFSVTAFRLVEQAIGEQMDGTPLQSEVAITNAAKAGINLPNLRPHEKDLRALDPLRGA